jgi:hypothetical protein
MKTITITISEKKLKGIINQAFRKGESWGVTYSSWFTPEKEDTAKARQEAIKRGFEIVNEPDL